MPDSGRDLAQPLLRRLRQSAERLHLDLVGDGLHEQFLAEVFRCGSAIEVDPALAQFRNAEIGQSRDLGLERFTIRLAHGISPCALPSRTWPYGSCPSPRRRSAPA